MNGGGILFKEPPPDVDLTSVPAEIRHYFIHTYAEVTGFGNQVVGSNIGRELIIMLPGLKKELCLKINDMVGVTMESGDAPNGSNLAATKVLNYWTSTNGYWVSCGSNNHSNRNCCVKLVLNGADPRIPTGSYVFFRVLHVR